MRRQICTTREELVAALMAGRDHLDLTNEVLEELSGISSGYAAKVLTLTPMRRLGLMSLDAILGALGLGIVAVVIGDDPEAIAQVKHRWERRRGRPRRQRPRRRRGQLAPPAEPESEPEADRSVRCCSMQQSVFDFENATEADDMKLIGARCDDGLAKQVEAAAAKQHRPVSQYVRLVLTDAVTKPEPNATVAADKPAPEVAE